MKVKLRVLLEKVVDVDDAVVDTKDREITEKFITHIINSNIDNNIPKDWYLYNWEYQEVSE